MKKTPVKLIVLDFNGVITTGSYKNISYWLAKKYKRSSTEIYETIYRYHNLAALKKLPEAEIFKKGLKDLGFSENPKMIEQTHAKITSILNKGIITYATSLRKRGYTVIGLSKNVPGMFKKNLKISGVKKYFDAFINTYDLNLPKASIKTIRYLMHEFKIKKPEEIILVDDQENNLIEGRKLGVHVFLYQNFKKLKKEIDAQLLSTKK